MPSDTRTTTAERARRLVSTRAVGRPVKTGYRRTTKFAVVMLVLGIIVWTLPFIVARPAVMNRALGWLTADFRGTVQVESASLGWMSPVRLRGVEIRDGEHRPVAELPAVDGVVPLWRWLLNLRRPGTWYVDRPRLHIAFDGGSSNVEQAFAAWLTPDGAGTSGGWEVGLVVRDAVIVVDDATSDRQWRLEGLAAKLDVPAALDKHPLELKLSCSVGAAAGRQQRQQGAVRLAVDVSESPSVGGISSAGQISLEADGFPIGIIEPIVRRWSDGSLSGVATAKVNCRWGAEIDGLRVATDLTAESLDLSGFHLEEEHIRLARLTMPCRLTYRDRRLDIEECNIDCDVGSLSLKGSLDTTASPFSLLTQTDYEISAQLDVARLAALLPRLLRLHQDVHVSSGGLALQISNRPSASGRQLQATVEATDLVATHRGQPVSWKQPLTATMAARVQQGGIRIDHLQCDSSFLQVSGSGSLEEAHLTGRFDLGRLAAEFGRFVDMAGIHLAGEGEFASALRPAAGKGITWDLVTHLTGLHVGGGSWTVAADGELELRGSYADGRHQAEQLSAVARQLRLQGGGLDVTEPHVELTAQDVTLVEGTRISATVVTIDSQGLVAEMDNVLLDWASGTLRPSARCRFSGSADRLKTWFAGAFVEHGLPQWQVNGQLEGTWDLATSERTTLSLEAAVRDMVVLHNGSHYWQEPQVTLAVQADYDRGSDQLNLAQLAVAAESAAISAKGSIASATTHRDLDLIAEVAYDWQRLTPLQHALAGEGVRLAGREQRTYRVRGRLTGDAPLSDFDRRLGRTQTAWTKRLDAEGSLGWQSAMVFGFPVDQGELKARLGGGRLEVAPFEWSVGGGKVAAAPRIRLSPKPVELELGKTRLVRDVRLTPEICDHALKFVAPVLAELAEVDGTISIELDGARIPLGSPANSGLSGTLSVAQIQLGTGPFLREIAMLSGHPGSVQLARNSAIKFHMVDGRVYHRDLEIVFPDLRIRTHGSVGLDQTLAVVAEMPIPPKWLGDHSVEVALKNQIIQVPIGGTLRRPRLDRAAFDRTVAELVRKTAAGAVRNEIGRGLQRLLRDR